ncbi:MAG: patatin-like phospholipase family protein [Cyanobacteria bacterium SZAS LIN-3]|nr:patatin-like phospholipase family protein [Cyanobacteria bacterium SZAS LIN-3]
MNQTIHPLSSVSRTEQTTSSSKDIHLLVGTGGSRAILFGTGVLLALAQADFRRFRSIGGVSGGSIPTALISANPDASALLSLVLDTDFNKLVKRRVSLIAFLTQVLRDPKPIEPPPPVGALDATAIGDFFNERIKHWPEVFWTTALSRQRKIVFTAGGIWQEQEDGALIKSGSNKIDLGTAVRATCAVPMLLDPIPWTSESGEEHLLIDGGLGPEGRCPISVPKQLFPMHNSFLVVVNVGEDKSTLHQLIDKVFGTVCDDRESLREDGPPLADNHSRIVVRPSTPLYGSFKFIMTRREKWQMILSGYTAAVEAFEKHGLLSGDTLSSARDRGIKALLLLAARRRPYSQDRLPTALEEIFANLKFDEGKFSEPTSVPGHTTEAAHSR